MVSQDSFSCEIMLKRRIEITYKHSNPQMLG